MTEDPIVEEVRRARDDYAKSFHYDLDAICRDLQQKQTQSGRPVVSFPPRRPVAITASPLNEPSNRETRGQPAAQSG